MIVNQQQSWTLEALASKTLTDDADLEQLESRHTVPKTLSVHLRYVHRIKTDSMTGLWHPFDVLGQGSSLTGMIFKDILTYPYEYR